jgi:hypothetical protein
LKGMFNLMKFEVEIQFRKHLVGSSKKELEKEYDKFYKRKK